MYVVFCIVTPDMVVMVVLNGSSYISFVCVFFVFFCVCVCCYSVSFCFFCKQNTAYDMRSSDWSSDVCSSDLRHLAPRRRAGARRRRPRLQVVDSAPPVGTRLRRRDDAGAEPGEPSGDPGPGALRLGDEPLFGLLDRLQDDRRKDRTSVAEGKGVAVRVDPGGAGLIKKT